MIYIARDMSLTVDDKFTLVAIPILAGAILRVPLGMLADGFGAKITGIIAQAVVVAAVAYAWRFGLHDQAAIEFLGLALGFAGASFAVALPQASRWYPPRYQGIVMGIVGAGNMGVVLDALIVPWIAEHYGWQNALGSLLIPLVLTFAIYAIAAKDAPGARRPLSWAVYRAMFADRDSWWFMFFYFITFGGFVGLANALPLYFTMQFHVSGIAAGLMAAMVVLFGSAFRPMGGYVADRFGGIRTLSVLFGVVALAYLAVAVLPPGPASAGSPNAWSLVDMPGIAWAAVAVFSVGVLALGMGNGAVFQIIPQRFRKEIGVITGLVGCAGGVGGFFLARVLGLAKNATDSFSGGFLFFSALSLLGLVALSSVKTRWRTTWGATVEARV
jgi:NNP family nitrate/nitrite transporter-like MFS transporter